MTSLLKTIVSGFVAFILCASLSAQRVEYTEVEATGMGRTAAVAIQDGLRQCVAQVCGTTIAADTKLQIVEATLSVNSATNSGAFEKLNNRIETATKGRVSSYRLVSQPQKTSAGFEVRVAAKIARYQQRGGQDSRLRLAFLPLRAARASYVCDGERVSGAIVSSQLLHALSQKMTSSRKFTVLDREYIDEIATEQRTIAESATSDDLCKLGAILGTDYIIAGTVENFGVETKNTRVGSVAVERKMGSAAVALRIIDVATGQVKFSETINTTSMAIRRNVSSASMDLAEQVSAVSASRILEAIYPLMVIACENGELVLNQGGEMVKVGDRYELFALGDKLKDPRTGESLGRKETRYGVIEIIRSKPKTSDAKIIEGGDDLLTLAEMARTGSLLCRAMKPVASKPAAPSLKDQVANEW